MVSSWQVLVMLACLTHQCIGMAATRGDDRSDEQTAREILRQSGVQGGLIVHLGCGQGQLTARLHAGAAFLVQGLETSATNVAKAREALRASGLYGKISIARFDGQRLPYADNLVNLVVAEGLGDVPVSEVMRVLAPRGVALLSGNVRGATEAKGEKVEIAGHDWIKLVKVAPASLDQWTHFLHDASNNAVSSDTVVAPPKRLKWTCGPNWSRSHEFNSSLAAMVSAQGRLFFVFDEGLTSITDPPIPERWTLTARDAFNGLLLWKRPLPGWGSGPWKRRALRSTPLTVLQSLVAEGDRVFLPLEYEGPVTALDAATGKVRTTYDDTKGSEETRLVDGVLVTRKGASQVIAVDTRTRRKLWAADGKIRPLSLAADKDRVFYQDGRQLTCRRLRDGAKLWQSPAQGNASLLLVQKGLVIALTGKVLQAVSADTGQAVWSVQAGVQRQELFVAQNRLWHWVAGNQLVGRDLRTGEVATRLDTSDVFTPGHHLRCYQTKATERFLITPNRGAEFVSLTDAPNAENDWLRGACRYGILPANGLLYAPPHPCLCNPGVMLHGFNALEAADAITVPQTAAQERLEQGPAFGQTGSEPAATVDSATDWTTYRHDPRRTGATVARVPSQVAERWRVRLDGKLTQPVIAANRLFVAAKDQHTVYALHAETGRKLWHFTADGPIDSPPTAHKNQLLFGSADGHVYCVRASDGVLSWRFQAAPIDRRIVAYGQLESPWRVHGSVLMERGVAYVTAGRSSYLDDGIWVYGLDPQTGRILCQTHLDTWSRTRVDAENRPFVPAYHIEGTRSDVLVSEGGFIYLGQYKFDRKLVPQDVPYVMPGPEDKTRMLDLTQHPYAADAAAQQADYEKRQRQWLERTQTDLLARLRQQFGGISLGQRRMGRHLMATAGFLDDSWFNRTFWMYSANWPGYYIAHLAPKTGQLLVIGPETTYAVQAFPIRNFQSPLFQPGGDGYVLMADANDNDPILDSRTRATTKGYGYGRKAPAVWTQRVPVRIRAMVLAGPSLFVAGPPDTVDPDDPMASFEGRKGAILRACSTADGHTLSERKLDAQPVFDGLSAADGRLFLATTDGSVICLSGQDGS